MDRFTSTTYEDPKHSPVSQAEVYQVMFEEQLPFILAAQQGEEQALARLEEISRGVRRSKAQKFLPKRPDLHEDAMQAGWKGVLRALQKWRPSWGRLFLAYAHWDISEAVRDFKYEMELTVARPTHIHRKLSKLSKFHTSDIRELAQLSGMSSDSILHAMATKQGDVSLQQLTMENGSDLASYLVGAAYDQRQDKESPSNALAHDDLCSLLKEAIATLEPREAQVILLYYRTDTSFGQIAQTLNLTRQRIEQINASALLKLQKFFLKKDPELGISLKKSLISNGSKKVISSKIKPKESKKKDSARVKKED